MAVVVPNGVSLAVKVDVGTTKFPVYRFNNIKPDFNLASAALDDFLSAFQVCTPGLIDENKGVIATVRQIVVPGF